MSKYIILLLLLSPVGIFMSSDQRFYGIGDTFNVTVTISPNNNSVVAYQIDTMFNPAVIQVNSVTKGNLFANISPNGAFYSSGAINNSRGTINDTFHAIIGRHNTSQEGIAHTYNVTTIGYGRPDIALYDVKISDPDGLPLNYTIISNFIKVTRFGKITGRTTV